MSKYNKRGINSMKKFLKIFLCLFVFIGAPSQAFCGDWWLFASAGASDCRSVTGDLTLRRTFDSLYDNEYFSILPLAEVSVNYVRKNSDNDFLGGTLSGGGLVLFNREGAWRPYLSATFGTAFFSETKFADKNFGISFQFRSKGALGIQFGEDFRHSIQIDYAHFSNAGLDNHNSGINTYCISYGFCF